MDIYELNRIENDTNVNNIQIKNYEYLYYDYIDITLGDPISSICLTSKYVIIGTMTGAIKLYYFTEKRIYKISKNNIENISGLSFSTAEKALFACIGDVHYLKYEMKEPFMDNSMPYSKHSLYETNSQHNYCCDNTYVLMSPNSILKVSIFQCDLQEKIDDDVYILYDITFLKKSTNAYNKTKIEGRIKSTNYYVPLDFDGNYFCWVEYINDKQDRNICIQNISTGEKYEIIDIKIPIDKDYGHVNHAKLLKNNKVLIIHDLNKCEIYEINEQYDKIDSFSHLGDEVYSVDILYGYNLLSKSYNKNNLIVPFNNFNDDECGTYNKIKVSESHKIKIQSKELRASKSDKKIDTLNMIKYNLQLDNNENYYDNYTIITLDIDGNVNKYENKKEEKLFNLYEINGIYQDFKDKKFFDMGYMYYIKTNLEYFCITTDHGCFIIKREEI